MDLNIYTTEMSKSVWDKAFFMDKIPGAKCIIDFGCADGAMIRFLAPLFPDITFIGYDRNEELLNRAMRTAPYFSNVTFFHNTDDIINFISLTLKFKSSEICINFSCVLHEVYSSTGGWSIIYDLITTLNPKYITIRDMYCDEPTPVTIGQIKDTFNPLWEQLPADKCAQFINKFGVITTWKKMTHLLMKLQWVDNGWEDEMKENYYSWNVYDFVKGIGNNYNIAFECRYQLPYLTEKWKGEYNWYNPDIHTHAQFILRRDD